MKEMKILSNDFNNNNANNGANNVSFATSPNAYNQYNNIATPFKVKVNPLTKVEFTKKDLISFLVTTVLLFMVSYIGILNSFNFGFTVSMFLFVTFDFVYLFNKKSKGKVFNLFLYISSVLLISSFSLNSDGSIKFITIIYLLFVLVISFTGISGNITEKDSNYYWFLDAIFKPITKTFENILSPFKSAKGSVKNNKIKNIMPVLIGIAVAVPMLFIIIPLLSSSDIAFESVVNSIFNNTDLIIYAILITLVLTPVFYSLIFYLKKTPSIGKETMKKNNGKLAVSGINAFLISISVVYLFYLLTQLAYIVDAFKLVLPENYTAAEFARSGFFQMAVIVFINFIVLGCTAINVKRNNFILPKSTKAILLFVSAFSIFYISTAIFKMVKYISLYGLTRLRVLTSIFMIMLALIFIIIILKLLFSKIKYIKPIIIVCTLTLLSISMVNINTVIADYNYKNFKSGKIEIDVSQIDSLGVSGIPVLTMLVDESDEEISFRAKEALYTSSVYIYNNAFYPDSEYITLAKKGVFEYNKIWIEAKEAIDNFKKSHPEFTKESFNKESNEYYDIDGDIDDEYYHWY